MRQALLMSLLAAAIASPAPALAQGGDPFGPLPQTPPPPPEQPAPQPVDRDQDGDAFGGRSFWLIVGSTGLVFAGIAFLIGRDMRRTAGTRRKRRKRGARPATAAAEALADTQPRHLTGSQKARAKAQKRAKAKAARKQRRKQRSR